MRRRWRLSGRERIPLERAHGARQFYVDNFSLLPEIIIVGEISREIYAIGFNKKIVGGFCRFARSVQKSRRYAEKDRR